MKSRLYPTPRKPFPSLTCEDLEGVLGLVQPPQPAQRLRHDQPRAQRELRQRLVAALPPPH